MVEPSEFESNVAYSIEDTIKQIKSSTDFVCHLKAKHTDSFAKNVYKDPVSKLTIDSQPTNPFYNLFESKQEMEHN